MRKITIATICIFTTTIAASGAVCVWQRQALTSVRQERHALTKQLSDLQTQYANVKTAAIISTSSWRRYCDPMSPLCLDYPPQWELEAGQMFEDRAYAAISSPDKTTRVEYYDPLIKDGGPLPLHVVSLADLTVSGTKLKIVGGYPVSSGIYRPSYTVMTAEAARDLIPGKIGLSGVNVLFHAGQYEGLALRSGPSKPFNSKTQTEAWFNSIEGKTVLKVIETFSSSDRQQ